MQGSGWFTDPTDASGARQRYWDGAVWTEWVIAQGDAEPTPLPLGRVAATLPPPGQEEAASDVEAPRAPRRRRRWWSYVPFRIALGLLIGLGIFLYNGAHWLWNALDADPLDVTTDNVDEYLYGGEDPYGATTIVNGVAVPDYPEAYPFYVSADAAADKEGVVLDDADDVADFTARAVREVFAVYTCYETDQMSDSEYAAYYEEVLGSEDAARDSILVRAAQAFICDVDHGAAYDVGGTVPEPDFDGYLDSGLLPETSSKRMSYWQARTVCAAIPVIGLDGAEDVTALTDLLVTTLDLEEDESHDIVVAAGTYYCPQYSEEMAAATSE